MRLYFFFLNILIELRKFYNFLIIKQFFNLLLIESSIFEDIKNNITDR